MVRRTHLTAGHDGVGCALRSGGRSVKGGSWSVCRFSPGQTGGSRRPSARHKALCAANLGGQASAARFRSCRTVIHVVNDAYRAANRTLVDRLRPGGHAGRVARAGSSTTAQPCRPIICAPDGWRANPAEPLDSLPVALLPAQLPLFRFSRERHQHDRSAGLSSARSQLSEVLKLAPDCGLRVGPREPPKKRQK
jgi:hypothetical protein